ncbi:hypothetical protein C8J56DRAFT_883537 [Mycena floridula]|nr:hypothetical protein C8J56DRAFT_883537 [Mycena floridula]
MSTFARTYPHPYPLGFHGSHRRTSSGIQQNMDSSVEEPLEPDQENLTKTKEKTKSNPTVIESTEWQDGENENQEAVQVVFSASRKDGLSSELEHRHVQIDSNLRYLLPVARLETSRKKMKLDNAPDDQDLRRSDRAKTRVRPTPESLVTVKPRGKHQSQGLLPEDLRITGKRKRRGGRRGCGAAKPPSMLQDSRGHTEIIELTNLLHLMPAGEVLELEINLNLIDV